MITFTKQLHLRPECLSTFDLRYCSAGCTQCPNDNVLHDMNLLTYNLYVYFDTAHGNTLAIVLTLFLQNLC